MKARWFTISCLVLMGFYLVLVAGVTGGDGPVLVIPERSFDFGYVSQNVSVSFPFVLKNEGTDSLFILNVKPG